MCRSPFSLDVKNYRTDLDRKCQTELHSNAAVSSTESAFRWTLLPLLLSGAFISRNFWEINMKSIHFSVQDINFYIFNDILATNRRHCIWWRYFIHLLIDVQPGVISKTFNKWQKLSEEGRCFSAPCCADADKAETGRGSHCSWAPLFTFSRHLTDTLIRGNLKKNNSIHCASGQNVFAGILQDLWTAAFMGHMHSTQKLNHCHRPTPFFTVDVSFQST